jgi:acyl-coenzyme A thioesterase PaaI-like protein
MFAPSLLSAPSTSLPSTLPGTSRALATVAGRQWISVRRGGVANSGPARYINHRPSQARVATYFPPILPVRRRSYTNSTQGFEPVLVTPTSTVPLPLPTATTTTTPPKPRRARDSLITTSLVLLFFTAGLIMSAAPAADVANGILNPPTDAETLTMFRPTSSETAAINDHITNHPLAQRLRAEQGVVESRPHLKIPEAMRPHNLTGGVLLGPGKIAVPPLSLAHSSEELPRLVQIAFLGEALCGHPTIVHGGLLATLLDEGLARACFPALPNKVGVTASLKIDYRAPCPAGSYVVLKAETTKVEGRKAWVKGWIEQLTEDGEPGVKYCEAEALFIEPKGAASMARIYSGA